MRVIKFIKKIFLVSIGLLIVTSFIIIFDNKELNLKVFYTNVWFTVILYILIRLEDS